MSDELTRLSVNLSNVNAARLKLEMELSGDNATDTVAKALMTYVWLQNKRREKWSVGAIDKKSGTFIEVLGYE